MSRSHHPPLYETDTLAWADEQGDALASLEASGSYPDVDWRNVRRTIEQVGQEEIGRVRNAVATLLGNAQRGYLDPDSHGRIRWMLSSLEAGLLVRRHSTPSIRARIDLDGMWRDVFDAAVRDVAPDLVCGIPPGLPGRCPFGWSDLVDERFTYEEAVRRLYDTVTATDESSDP